MGDGGRECSLGPGRTPGRLCPITGCCSSHTLSVPAGHRSRGSRALNGHGRLSFQVQASQDPRTLRYLGRHRTLPAACRGSDRRRARTARCACAVGRVCPLLPACDLRTPPPRPRAERWGLGDSRAPGLKHTDLSEVFFLKWEIRAAHLDAYHHLYYWHSGVVRHHENPNLLASHQIPEFPEMVFSVCQSGLSRQI